jgi:hypothetical protein
MSYCILCGIGSQNSNISKGKKGGGVHIKITGMQDSNQVDRNKNVTLNICSWGSYE